MMVAGAAAQGRPELKRPEPDVPQEKPPEPKKKPVKGPRAVGIVQLTASGKATLIPVAILIDGKFYDASAYKADPVPMALDSGTVYEVEQAGDSQGLFTVSGALHSKNPGSVNPWVGAGSFLPKGTEVEKTTRKAEDVPVGINNDSDAPPRLTRGSAAKPAAPSSPSSTPASKTPSSSTPAGAGSSEKPAASSQPASGSSAPVPAGDNVQKPAAPAASDKPADHPDQSSAKQQSPPPTAGQTSPGPSSSGQTTQGQPPATQAPQGQASPGQGENYYRPTLRRGKPTEPSPPDDEETAPKTGKADAGKTGSPPTAAAAGPVRLVAAISDAGGPDPRSYKFFWKPGEEDEKRNEMLALAGDEVRAYATALARNQIPAKPPATKPATAGHKAPAKPIQPVLENVQFHAFDVWVNNQVVMILTAEAHFPSATLPAKPPTTRAAAAPEQYSITLVARTDIYGNLRKLYSGVTDKFHLDVTPRLDLIDVVDADGDGRGELLFRETTDAGSGYVIYRPTADKLWKMFDSLAE